jgi:hypothetical protein
MRRAAQAQTARLARIARAAAGASTASGDAAGARCEPRRVGAAAAAAAAAAGVSLPIFWSLAEAGDDDVSRARAAVAAAWEAVDEEAHRDEAALPAAWLAPPTPPVVTVDGDRIVTVEFRLRPGADGASVLDALARTLPPPLRASPAPGGGFRLASESGVAAGIAAVVAPDGRVTLRAHASALAAPGGAAPVEAGLRAATCVVKSTVDGGTKTRAWSWSGSVGGGDPAPLDPAALLLSAADEILGRALDGAATPSRGGIGLDPRPPPAQAPRPRARSPADAAAETLRAVGCTVTPPPSPALADPWARTAGYAPQKEAVRLALLPLTHADVCRRVSDAARSPAVRAGAAGPPPPRAILFDGPPGCGKTATAAAAAAVAGATLVYVPVEAIASKWYGEAEQRLASVFEAAHALADGGESDGALGASRAPAPADAGSRSASPPGVVVFIDEVDSLATARSGDMHEATRRCLGVLLRSLDGFATQAAAAGGRGRVTAILATNRPGDVDAALASRCAARVHFPLPDADARAGIVRLYASHLSERDVARLADAAAGLSGRDLRDAAEAAERSWASAVVAGRASPGTPPPAGVYADAVRERALARVA